MKLTAQKLILDLVSAATDQTISARAVVVVARLFDLSENNVRVALARLVSRGRLARRGRGEYTLAAGARPVQRHVSSWARIEERRAPWGGGWCGVYLSRPGRAGRSSARQRQRALDFLGMRELEPGLWVRPDNLVGGVVGLRTELRELGLDTRSRVFALGDLDPETDARARGLWDTRALDAAYGVQLRRLRRSGRALAKREQAAAVGESFLVGGAAINLLAFDPLLPDEILPGGQRRALVEEMSRYDRLGRACWRDFAKQQGVPGIVLPRARSVDAAGMTPTGG